ncbi:dynamin family protein [Cellulomonas sp. PhB143]|uniref:dynamin family protein n=1 Tax=Cellulomonas sp. PhB143 TaxID=2485186 RepID=UPI000F489EB5|nr:dynamin family protein [Cellulomonas sp. PhB143]
MTEPGRADAGAREPTLVGPLVALRETAARLRLPLGVPGLADDVAARDGVVAQLDDYLLPRLRAARAPLLVVVGGSTGAGKSTLLNSLLGARVSAAGVLRPTTRAPLLVHRPEDERWFADDRVLGSLSRRRRAPREAPANASGVAAPRGESGELVLVASDLLPAGLALLDAPDLDSVSTENRALAAQLFAAADLWLFVTTASRYADAVPWDALAGAAARHAQVAVVLDRADPAVPEVAADLGRLMREHGLEASDLLVVPEDALVDGLLPERAVAPVADRLTALGADPARRGAVAAATRDGAVDDVVVRTRRLAAAARRQQDAAHRLREAVHVAHDEARDRIGAATRDGSMLRGEVLARWQDFVGTGEFFRALERRVGRARDRVVAFLRGRPRAPEVEEAIAHGLAAVLLDAADAAAERTGTAWLADPAGRELVGAGLDRAAPGLADEVATTVREWQGDVLGLVREQGQGRRGVARALSFGLNGVGVSLMVVVFASTGGLTGAEVGIAGGTALAAQKVLEAVFGDDAVRRLTRVAHERLDARAGEVLDRQARRWTDVLDELGAGAPGPGALGALADAVEQVALAERAERPAAGALDPGAADGGRLRGAGAGAVSAAPSTGPGDGAQDAVVPGPRRRGLFRRRHAAGDVDTAGSAGTAGGEG